MVVLKGACRNYDALWYCLARCRDVGSDYNIFFFCSVLYDHEHKTVAVCVHTHSSCCASWESCCPNDAMQDHGCSCGAGSAHSCQHHGMHLRLESGHVGARRKHDADAVLAIPVVVVLAKMPCRQPQCMAV